MMMYLMINEAEEIQNEEINENGHGNGNLMRQNLITEYFTHL